MATAPINTVKPAPTRFIYNNPKIVFSRRAWALCWLYVQICDVEISWMGSVDERVDEDGKPFYYIENIYLLKQVCGPGDTTIDALALGELMTTLPPEEAAKVRFWGHSHVNMGVFWSETDYAAMRQLKGGGTTIYTVFNKKGLHKTCLDFCQGPHDYRIDDIADVTYESRETGELLDPYVNEFSAKFGLDPDTVERLLLNFMRKTEMRLEDTVSFDEETTAFAKAEFAQKVTTRTYYTAPYSKPSYNNATKRSGEDWFDDEKAGMTLQDIKDHYGYDALTPAEKKRFDAMQQGKGKSKGRRGEGREYMI